MKKIGRISLVFLVMVTLANLFLWVSTPVEAGSKAEWTFLFYFNADNNLDLDAFERIDEMELVGPPPGVNVVVLIDRPSYRSKGINPRYRWSEARMYRVIQDNKPAGINSPVIKNLGEVNMCAEETLKDFLLFGMRNFPAKHYALFLNAHGSGWGMGPDYSAHRDFLTIEEIALVLRQTRSETGVKLDLIVFDSCNMGTLEGAYELKDTANFMLASPTVTIRAPWDRYSLAYDFLLRDLAFNPTVSPLDLTKKLVEFSGIGGEIGDHEYRLLGLELARMPELELALLEFSAVMRRLLLYPGWTSVMESLESVCGIGETDTYYGRQVDFYALVSLLPNYNDENVSLAARKGAEIREILDRLFMRAGGEKNASAFSIFVNNRPSENKDSEVDGTIMHLARYQNLAFAKATGWGAYLGDREAAYGKAKKPQMP